MARSGPKMLSSIDCTRSRTSAAAATSAARCESLCTATFCESAEAPPANILPFVSTTTTFSGCMPSTEEATRLAMAVT